MDPQWVTPDSIPGEIVKALSVEAAKSVGGFAVGRAKSLWARLKQEFAGRSRAEEILLEYEIHPDASKPQTELTAEIQSSLQQNPGLFAELAALLKELRPEINIQPNLASANMQGTTIIAQNVQFAGGLTANPSPSSATPPPQAPTPPRPVRNDDPFEASPTLFGREGALDELKRLLAAPQPRIIQLHGERSIGKTVLAAAAVHDVVGPDGYVRVKVKHAEGSEAFIARLYAAMTGETAPALSLNDLLSAIFATWEQRKCLLVLDDMHELLNEHGNPKDDNAAALISALQQHGGKLLAIGWQRTQTLGSSRQKCLPMPLKGINADAGVKKIRAEGVEGDPQHASLENVVSRLGGNPGLLEYLARLIEDHNGDVTIIDQHPEWVKDGDGLLTAMWRMLGPKLQELLVSVCILRYGRSVERLATLLERNPDDVKQELRSLVRWSLVKWDKLADEYVYDRDLVLQMVRDQLSEVEFRQWQTRTADMWLAESESIGENGTPTSQQEIQPLLEAVYHLMLTSDIERLDSRIVKRMFGNIGLHELADRLGAWSEMTALFEYLVGVDAEAVRIADWRHSLGICYGNRCAWERALAEYTASLEIMKKQGDLLGIAATRHQIGRVYQNQGDWEWALAEYRTSLEILKKLGDLQGIAKSQHQIGWVYQNQGDWERALAEYRASQEIEQKLGNLQGIAQSRYAIGTVYQDHGDWERALAEYRASLEIMKKLGDLQGIAQSQHQIGRVYQNQGDWERALAEYRASQEIEQKLGNLQGIAATRHQIGWVYQDQGDWERALAEYEASLEIEQKLGDLQGIAATRHQIGVVYQDQGDWERALAEYRASLEIKQKLGNRHGTALTLGQMGLLYRTCKNYNQALSNLWGALSIFAKLGSPFAHKAARHLYRLRVEWGAENFDPEWKKLTGEEVPDWLTGEPPEETHEG